MKSDINIEEILEDTFWFDENGSYVLSSDWEHTIEETAQLKAFEWSEKYSFFTPVIQFHINIRETKQEVIFKRMVTNYESAFARRYNVLLRIAESGIPLSSEHWESEGGPWRSYDMYTDCFYAGKWYLDEFEGGRKPPGTPSSLIKGFDDLKEATSFMENWKERILKDHHQVLKKSRELIQAIQRLDRS